MNAKKILALLLGAMMLLALAACGAKDNDKQADMSGDSSAMTGEPKTAEEALALHKELLERENALLSENAELFSVRFDFAVLDMHVAHFAIKVASRR